MFQISGCLRGRVPWVAVASGMGVPFGPWCLRSGGPLNCGCLRLAAPFYLMNVTIILFINKYAITIIFVITDWWIHWISANFDGYRVQIFTKMTDTD